MNFKALKHIAVYTLIAASMTSCDLDVIPPSDISSETFWKTEKDAWSALNSLYAELPGMDIWDEMYTDNAHSHKPWEGAFELVQTNGITAGNDFGYGYSTIRIANTFLANVDRCDLSEDMKKRMKAEARFFRAWNYLQLTTKFGKVALLGDEIPAFNAPYKERNSVEEVRNYILSELEQIADALPNEYDGSYCNEAGRITRAAALALRARAALYFGNYAEAEKSAGLVISEKHHDLFRVTSLNAAQLKEAQEMEMYIDFDDKGIEKDKFIKGLFSYETLWHSENANPNNPEYILTREYMADDNNADWSRYTYIRPSQMISGYSSYEPMQDLIEAYWDIDGKTIREPKSVEERLEAYSNMWVSYFAEPITNEGGEVTSYKSIPFSSYQEKVAAMDIRTIPYMEEFRNRDSRLYASILFPLKGWHETDCGTFYYMWDPLKVAKDGNESWTGYSYRKLVSLTPYQGWQGSDDYPVIRYAEVLLTYAEARIQTTGYDEKVRVELNKLRDRCGMPDVPTVLDKAAALELVRNERRIELAAEGHRYDDVRRYEKAYREKHLNGPTYAPCGNYGYDAKAQKYKWQPYTVIDMVWNERLLLMPIPTSAMDVNPLLEEDQNPGY